MKTILDIVNRNPKPAPWSEGDNIPWDDPAFSERMLRFHLSQDIDLASRKTATIDEHTAWIMSSVLDNQPARVLDLGCGPGLYAERLADAGCEYVGIDFSPASIRHAREIAAKRERDCHFIQGDLRTEKFGEGFDLVMMIFGQINVFARNHAMKILRKAHAALKPGGRLVLEYQDPEQIQKGGETGPSWYSAPAGLFSDEPHIVLQENVWDAEAAASTSRFFVIDGTTGAVSNFALSNEAYTDEQLDETLRNAGFAEIQRYPSLSGQAATRETDLPVIVAQRPGTSS